MIWDEFLKEMRNWGGVNARGQLSWATFCYLLFFTSCYVYFLKHYTFFLLFEKCGHKWVLRFFNFLVFTFIPNKLNYIERKLIGTSLVSWSNHAINLYAPARLVLCYSAIAHPNFQKPNKSYLNRKIMLFIYSHDYQQFTW